MMNKQVVPSSVVQNIIVIFLTNKNVKPVEILMRLRAQFSDEMLQGSRCMTGVNHLKKAKQRLKTCEDYTFCREVTVRVVQDSQGILFFNFLTEQ
jgi:hypothetical protein